MDALPQDVKLHMHSSGANATESTRKHDAAVLVSMLEDYERLLSIIDERDKLLERQGHDPPAAVNQSGRRIKKPKNFEENLGGRESGSGGKRKRKHANGDYDQEQRISRIHKKFDNKKKELIEKVARLFQTLSRHKDYKIAMGWFFRPVDRALVPDYYTVVTNPMHIEAIVEKIRAREYPSLDAVRDDINLVWANCRLYNKVGSSVRAAGDMISGVVDMELKKLGLEAKWLELEAQTAAEIAAVRAIAERAANGNNANNANNANIANNNNNSNNNEDTDDETQVTPVAKPRKPQKKKKKREDRLGMLQKQVSDLTQVVKKQNSRPAAPSAPKRPAEQTLREMTYEEKTEMIDDLNKIPEDKLGHILRIVQESNSKEKAIAEDGGEEVELDIEALDNKTLWTIKNWLGNYMKGKAKQEAHKKKVKRERAARREQEGGILDDMSEGTEDEDDAVPDKNIQVANADAWKSLPTGNGNAAAQGPGESNPILDDFRKQQEAKYAREHAREIEEERRRRQREQDEMEAREQRRRKEEAAAEKERAERAEEETRRRKREEELEAELAEEEEKLRRGDRHNIEAERDSLNRLARGSTYGDAYMKPTENYESEPDSVSTDDRMRMPSHRAVSDTENDSERP